MKKIYKWWYVLIAGVLIGLIWLIRFISKSIGNCKEKEILNMLYGHYKFVIDKLKYKVHQAQDRKKSVWAKHGGKALIILLLISNLSANIYDTPEGPYEFESITNYASAQSEYIILQQQELTYLNMQLSIQSNYIYLLEKSKGVKEPGLLERIWDEVKLPLFLVIGFYVGSR